MLRPLAKTDSRLEPKGMEQISHRKQNEAEHSAQTIGVMAKTMLHPPIHGWEQVNGLCKIRNGNHQHTSRSKCLKKRVHRFSLMTNKAEPTNNMHVGTNEALLKLLSSPAMCVLLIGRTGLAHPIVLTRS